MHFALTSQESGQGNCLRNSGIFWKFIENKLLFHQHESPKTSYSFLNKRYNVCRVHGNPLQQNIQHNMYHLSTPNRTCKGDTAQQPVQLVPKSLGIHREFPKSFSQECIRIHELPICFFEKQSFFLCFKKWLDVVNSSLVFFLRFVNRETVLMFC